MEDSRQLIYRSDDREGSAAAGSWSPRTQILTMIACVGASWALVIAIIFTAF